MNPMCLREWKGKRVKNRERKQIRKIKRETLLSHLIILESDDVAYEAAAFTECDRKAKGGLE